MAGLKGSIGLGFVSKGWACQAGSRATGKLAPSGYVDCEDIPAASGGFMHPAAAPVSSASTASVQSSIAPTIITQVSPQISPQFIQQFQPSGSGIQAGTSQGGSPVTATDPNAQLSAQLMDMIAQQQRDQNLARQQAADAATKAAAQAAQDQADKIASAQRDKDANAAQSAALIAALQTAQAPNVPASSASPAPLPSVASSAAFASPMPGVSSPVPSAPAPDGSVPVAVPSSNAGLIIAAVAGVGLLFIVMRKGKRK